MVIATVCAGPASTSPFCSWNPSRCAVTSKCPVGSDAARNPPVPLVTTVRSEPVAVWRTVTVAPGSTAPCASVTVPWMVAVDCAVATGAVGMKLLAGSQLWAYWVFCILGGAVAALTFKGIGADD